MAQTMSPSDFKGLTTGQAAKFADLQIAALRKSGLPSEPTQRILEEQGAVLADEFVASIRKRVEAASNLIVRRVAVDRSRTPKQALDATGRRQYVNQEVVKTMPRGEGAGVEVFFFRVGRNLSDPDLDKEYKLRGLIPADAYSQAAVNETDPAFADDHPNATHWQDAAGQWCCATFNDWGVDPFVHVCQDGRGWSDRWWFAGLRKA